jgi:2-polyprenyl-3-methyl-5-hydroxy-6-metoxy-1,4-benzoquinol methylase
MPEYRYSDAELCCSSVYILPALTKILKGLPRHSTVADVGCGNGSLLAQFRPYGWDLHGLDHSASGIAQATAAYSGIQFRQADFSTDLSSDPLAGRCDMVISTEVVEHLFLPRIYARNCYRLLRPAGRFVLSTPYHGYLKNLALAATGKMDSHFTALWDHGHVKFWSRRTLTLLLQEAGFRVTAFYGVGRIPFLWKSMILVAEKQEN